MRNLLSLILLLFSAFTTLFAEKTIIKLEQYTTEDGLAHRTVSGMLQDKTGLIWFATWNGLCSFDGNKFKTYKPEDDNANIRVEKIWELDNGVFVCRMYNERVLLFNPKTEEFSLYNNDDLLPPKINSLYKVDYDNERLSFRNTKTDSVYYYKIGNSGIHLGVHYSFTDKQGNVWLNFNDRILKFSFTPDRKSVV